MKMTKALYRYMLLFNLLLGLAAVVVDETIPQLIPEVLREAQAAHRDQVALDDSQNLIFLFTMVPLILTLLVLVIVTFYGLFTFRPWAPRLAVAEAIVVTIVLPFFGHTLVSGVADSLTYSSTLLWGACLMLAFVPPYSHWFKRESPQPDPQI